MRQTPNRYKVWGIANRLFAPIPWHFMCAHEPSSGYFSHMWLSIRSLFSAFISAMLFHLLQQMHLCIIMAPRKSSSSKKIKALHGSWVLELPVLKRPFKNRDQYPSLDENSRTQFSALLYSWHGAHCWWMTLRYAVLVIQARAVPKPITQEIKYRFFSV